ncbi:MAG: choice-of-anchor D domain-containing protein, partial [Desulfomonilia bacterium]|nr:choice-of-anchor D domain-containing protein [Desulfomonilia bacterium]
RQIDIKTNDPDVPEVSVYLQATVVEMLSVNPPILNFGKVKQGLTHTKELTLTNTSKTTLVISGIEGNPPAFLNVSAECPITIEPGQSHTMTVTLAPGSTKSRFHGYISILTELEFLPRKILRVAAQISRE